MADMIDAKEAKALLGCDDATLNGHINGGAIRAQRVAGKLMLNHDDVMKVKGDDDGTIVLTGDSDELNIDLGKVVDDASETIIQPRRDASASATESITFGDDLEVVSFDDGNTKDMNFDKKKATSSGGLSFTDSNTAVMTAVDETAVGGTTGPVDYTTSQMDSSNSAVGSASRRSVRSARRPVEEVKTHWAWVIVMALTFVMAALFIMPYYVIALMPSDQKDAAGNVQRGSEDNGWTSFASSAAGFSVDPDKKRFEKNHEGAVWIDIKDVKDNQATWRRDEYLGSAKPGERVNDFVIVEIQAEGRKAKPASGDKTYDVHDEKTDMQGDKGSILEQRVDLGFPK
jgi:uncharacterized protein YaaQ